MIMLRTESELYNLPQEQRDAIHEESEKIVKEQCEKKCAHAYIAAIPLHLLNTPDCQRELDMARAEKIAKMWDDDNCAVITVAYIDGFFWVIDGQHRVNAALIAHLCNTNITEPITELCCQVFLNKTKEDACLTFVAQNDKKPLSPYNKYHALLGSKNKENKGAIAAQLIYNIITVKYGVPIQSQSQKGCLSAVQAPFILAQRKSDAKEALDWIFGVLVNSDFYQQDSGMAADIIRGMEDIYDTFKDYHLGVATKVCINIFEDNTYKTLLSKYAKYYQGIDKRTAIKHYFKKCIGEQMLRDKITPPPTVVQAIDMSKAGVSPSKTPKKPRKKATKKGTTSDKKKK